MRTAHLLALALVASGCPRPLPAPAPAVVADGFWPHWGDGRGELAGYRLVQPRYGAPREGHAVLVFVTEDFDPAARVKAERPGKGTVPVLKLNEVRRFQTGIYDYGVMTSTFARVHQDWPVLKVSFSAQEWCGHVYHQLLPGPDAIESTLHSYFEGEADRAERLPMPAGGLLADALPILVRGLLGDLVAPGASIERPLLPRLLRSRLEHRPVRWTTARIERAAEARRRTVPAGTFEVETWTVTPADGPALTYEVERAAPRRLVRWSASDGEEASLLGSERLPYWELNGPGGERHLSRLGLRPYHPQP